MSRFRFLVTECFFRELEGEGVWEGFGVAFSNFFSLEGLAGYRCLGKVFRSFLGRLLYVCFLFFFYDT